MGTNKKSVGRQTSEQRAEERRVAQAKATAERKARNKKILIGAGAVLVVALIPLIMYFAGAFSKPDKYLVEIDVQNYGVITVELDRTAAPITVDNFVKLAKSGFYDGLTFHRIIEGFMIQGGDPEGTGAGGSAASIKGEFPSNGVNNPLKHTRGTISMARTSVDKNSASSQFFIVHQDATASLDGDYAAFGHVTSGMEFVDAIATDATPIEGTDGLIAAAEQPIMNSVRVVE